MRERTVQRGERFRVEREERYSSVSWERGLGDAMAVAVCRLGSL